MYCVKCGKELPEGSAYCPACGVKINNSNNTQENVTEGNQSSKGIIIAVVSVGVALILCIIGAVIFLNGRIGSKNQEQEAKQEIETTSEAALNEENNSVQDEQEEVSDPFDMKNDNSGSLSNESEKSLVEENKKDDDQNNISEDASTLVKEGFEIYADTTEDYNKCLDIKEYIRYDSGIGGFSFYYPDHLFNNVIVSDITKARELDVIGRQGQEIIFLGDKGTQLQYKVLYYDTDRELEKEVETIHANLISYLYDTQDISYKVNDDNVRFVVTGLCEGEGKMYAYSLVKVMNGCFMEYTIVVNDYADDTDRLQKNYVTECLYRMCGFSDSKNAPRSWEEYLAEEENKEPGYTNDAICKMCLDYYEKTSGYRPGIAMVDSENGDEIVVHLFDDMGDHTATSEWYYINRKTGKGTNFFGESVSIW